MLKIDAQCIYVVLGTVQLVIFVRDLFLRVKSHLRKLKLRNFVVHV